MRFGGLLRLHLAVFVLSVSAAVPGCRSEKPSTEVAIEAVAVSSSASGGDPDASDGESVIGECGDGGALPVHLAVEVLAFAEDARRTLSLEKPNEQLAPDSHFELEMPRMADVRVQLFDESDRAVPSNDRLKVGPKTRYLLRPAEALDSGSKYTLIVDGLTDALPTDASGVTYELVRVALTTAGEKPAPVTPGKKSKSLRGKKKGR